MTGRPTALTPEVHDRIVSAVRMGATYALAAMYGGVTYETLNNWRNRGAAELERIEGGKGRKVRKKEAPFVHFFNAIKEAEGAAAVGWLAKIEKAASDGNWQAAAWKLERRYPSDYGRKVTELTGEGGGEVVIRVEYDD